MDKRKIKGGAEKIRERKRKVLEADVGKNYKLTKMFAGAAPPPPSNLLLRENSALSAGSLSPRSRGGGGGAHRAPAAGEPRVVGRRGGGGGWTRWWWWRRTTAVHYTRGGGVLDLSQPEDLDLGPEAQEEEDIGNYKPCKSCMKCAACCYLFLQRYNLLTNSYNNLIGL